MTTIRYTDIPPYNVVAEIKYNTATNRGIRRVEICAWSDNEHDARCQLLNQILLLLDELNLTVEELDDYVAAKSYRF